MFGCESEVVGEAGGEAPSTVEGKFHHRLLVALKSSSDTAEE